MFSAFLSRSLSLSHTPLSFSREMFGNIDLIFFLSVFCFIDPPSFQPPLPLPGRFCLSVRFLFYYEGDRFVGVNKFLARNSHVPADKFAYSAHSIPFGYRRENLLEKKITILMHLFLQPQFFSSITAVFFFRSKSFPFLAEQISGGKKPFFQSL